MVDKRKRSRGKPSKGAPSLQPSSSAPGVSLEFPPPPQEAALLEVPIEELGINETDVLKPPYMHPDYHFNMANPLPTDPVDIHVPKEISANDQEREEALKQKVQEIAPEMKKHLKAYVASEKGSGFIKKTLIPGFFRDKGFSNEEIAEIVGRFDDKNYQKDLIAKAIARASNVFSQDKVSASQVWQNESLTGYAAAGVLQSSLNGIIDDECRRIIAAKEAERAAEAEKAEKNIFSPEQLETLDLIVGASKRAWESEVKKAENWGPGFTPEVVFQIIDGMTVGAIRGILKERSYSEDEIEKAIEYIMPKVRTK